MGELGSLRGLNLETALFQHLICFSAAAPFGECSISILFSGFEKAWETDHRVTEEGMRKYVTLAVFVLKCKCLLMEKHINSKNKSQFEQHILIFALTLIMSHRRSLLSTIFYYMTHGEGLWHFYERDWHLNTAKHLAGYILWGICRISDALVLVKGTSFTNGFVACGVGLDKAVPLAY